MIKIEGSNRYIVQLDRVPDDRSEQYIVAARWVEVDPGQAHVVYENPVGERIEIQVEDFANTRIVMRLDS